MSSSNNISSVPSGTLNPSISGKSLNSKSVAFTQETFGQDCILMYCSYFTYGKDQARTRRAFCDGLKSNDIITKLETLERKYFPVLKYSREKHARHVDCGYLERVL